MDVSGKDNLKNRQPHTNLQRIFFMLKSVPTFSQNMHTKQLRLLHAPIIYSHFNVWHTRKIHSKISRGLIAKKYNKVQTLVLTTQMILLRLTVIRKIKREDIGAIAEHRSPDPVGVIVAPFLLLCVDVVQLLLRVNHCSVPSITKT